MVPDARARPHHFDHFRRVDALDGRRPCCFGWGFLQHFSRTACWLGLLLSALAFHELGHAVAAYWLDCDQDEVHIWPLGNLVGPSHSSRSSEHVLVSLAGLLTAEFLSAAAIVHFLFHAQFV